MKPETARQGPLALDAGLQLYLRSLAHDFNNLLGAILGNAALLETMVPPGSEAAETSLIIQRAAERATELAGHLSRAARLEAPHHEPVDLNASLREIAELLRVTLPPRVLLRTELEEPLPTVMGDPVEIHQLALNLATNARDAIASLAEPCGVTLLATTHTPIGALLRVHDTGPGIPHDLQQRIFQPFFTTREDAVSGRGLGLTIVERVARRHGAQLTLHSEPGKGADFQVVFPAPR